MADEGKGKAEHLGGRIREKAGELLGDREMERKGRLDQRKGRARQDEERALDKAQRARNERLDAEIEKDLVDDDRI